MKDKDGQISEAISAWERAGIIDGSIAERLRNTLGRDRGSARSETANYLLIIATGTALLAAAALFLDERILEVFRLAYAIPHWILALLLAAASAACFWYVGRKKGFSPAAREIRLLPGALLAMAALVYACKSAMRSDAYMSAFLGLSSLLLGLLAFRFRSSLLLTAAILAGMGWYAEWTTEAGHDYFFLGMNYPLRFVPLAILLGVFTRVLYRRKLSWPAAEIMMHSAFITAVTAGWGLSVFGNYNHLEEWYTVRQTAVLLWGGIFAVMGLLSLLYGIRNDFRPARDYGLLAILLNLYTRFFEAFWDGMNKGLFFLILAATLFLLARWIARDRSGSRKNEV